MNESNTILRLPAVKRRTGLGRSTIYNMMEIGTFPQAIKIGKRAIGWREQDIVDWVNGRLAVSLI